ncbi:GGDEF domain-containing protein [Mangrovitalea sediminis]|uniref:GGDEF domain-containing protein n=1 Tax=Mangrovitalea sediminis TaxID=1982043 RepID=UPI000BE6185B|nr:GGDEF domain-containing protein [Mangrovitalea sediminis]
MTDRKNSPRFQNLLEDEERRTAQILSWLSLTAVVFLVAIGLESWHAGHEVYGQSLFLFATLVLGNLAYYRRTGNRFRQKWGLLTIVAILFAYLIASGGESNTGPLWFYVFPPLVFYLTGLRIGLMMTGGCLLFALIVFRFPSLPFVEAHYSWDFEMRFFATLLFETIFCYVLDYSRRSARNELVELAALYERAARTDELTAMSNRRDMLQHLTKEFSRYERSGHHFSAVLMDLDHFKRINDVYGHDAGDFVLTEFAHLVQSVCRKSDVASRWGGEEFLVLLPDTSLLQALALAERLRYQVEQHNFTFKDQTIPLTLSAGVCSITQANSVEKLLKQADVNLYEAKMKGRNQIVPRVRQQLTDSVNATEPSTRQGEE